MRQVGIENVGVYENVLAMVGLRANPPEDAVHPLTFKEGAARRNSRFEALNKDGGIEIYIAAKKANGVPDENWLPINRKMSFNLRIYVRT